MTPLGWNEILVLRLLHTKIISAKYEITFTGSKCGPKYLFHFPEEMFR